MNAYLKFLGLIITKGTFQYRIHDFNTERAENLKHLTPFIPKKIRHPLNTPSVIRRNDSGFSKLKAQAAYIKSCFRNSGGHLATQTLAYIRIPKSGNTSLSFALLTQLYPDLKTQTLTDTQINFLADVNLKPVAEADTEQFFTVVRDPFKRLVSVYRDFFESEHPHFLYQDYLFGILHKEITFAEFVNRVSRIPDRLKDQHLKPQHCFLTPYTRQNISPLIFRLEEPEKLKAFLAEHTLALTHRNKSGEAYDYSKYYTPALLNKAYEMYRTDVESFGYTQAFAQLKSGL